MFEKYNYLNINGVFLDENNNNIPIDVSSILKHLNEEYLEELFVICVFEILKFLNPD